MLFEWLYSVIESESEIVCRVTKNGLGGNTKPYKDGSAIKKIRMMINPIIPLRSVWEK